jgi:hypothetical protein
MKRRMEASLIAREVPVKAENRAFNATVDRVSCDE